MASAAEDKLRAARGRFAFLRPHFDHAVYALVLIEEPRCQSLGVDNHKRLYFNPEFVSQFSVEQLVPMIYHELSHVLRDHLGRSTSFGVTNATAHIANIAQDCEINDDMGDEIEDRNDMPHLPASHNNLPEQNQLGVVLDRDMPWEVYYQKLLDQMDHITVVRGVSGRGGAEPDPNADPSSGQQGDANGDDRTVVITHDCGSGAHGVPRPWEQGDPGHTGNAEGVSDADWKEIQQITAEKIIARQKAKGDVPAGWKEWADDLLRPRRIPWDQELSGGLRHAITDTSGMVLHSYKKPSRRASALPDVILPCMRKPRPFVCIIGDTSGSMNVQHDLALVRGVTEDICQAMGARVAFLATDAEVHGGIQQVTDGRKLDLRGRGGTNMAAGMAYAMENLRPRPDVLVVATDCGTDWPSTPPRSCKVIVCAIGAWEEAIARVPKWARLIRVEPIEKTS